LKRSSNGNVTHISASFALAPIPCGYSVWRFAAYEAMGYIGVFIDDGISRY
jgi:hypothetical protein